jgi:hypothetical protein
MLTPSYEQDGTQHDEATVHRKSYRILPEHLQARLGIQLTGSSQEEVELRRKPIKKHSVDYEDLFFEVLPFAENRKLSNLGIVVDERFTTVREIKLMEYPKLARYRCSSSALRRTLIWP